MTTYLNYARNMGPTMSRSVDEGYDVRMAVVVDIVRKMPAQSELLSTTNGLPLSIERRPSPSDKAFEILDELMGSVPPLPEEVTIEGWMVARATWPTGLKSTVATARVITPWFPPRLLVWDAE